MPQILTDEQRDKLVNTPDWRTRLGRRDRALLAVMAYGGLRIQEAAHLRRDEITFEGEKMRLTFAGKGGYIRTVTMPEKAAKLVKAYIVTHTSAFAFPGREDAPRAKAGHLEARSVRARVAIHAKKAGMPSWFHAHSLRHTFGSTVMRKTGDLFLTSRVLGHRSVKTTADYYLAFDASYADKAAEVF